GLRRLSMLEKRGMRRTHQAGHRLTVTRLPKKATSGARENRFHPGGPRTGRCPKAGGTEIRYLSTNCPRTAAGRRLTEDGRHLLRPTARPPRVPAKTSRMPTVRLNPGRLCSPL